MRARIAAAKRVSKKLEAEFKSRMLTFVSTALGVVAALFWQTAITDTIKSFMPVNGAWFYEIGVAILVTILAVMAILILSNIPDPSKKK